MNHGWQSCVLRCILMLGIVGIMAEATSLSEKYMNTEIIHTKLAEEHLPTLENLLAELGMSRWLPAFYDRGISEVNVVMHMTTTDLRMMDLEPEEVQKLVAKAKELRVEQQTTVVTMHPLLEERNALVYGRLFLHNAVSSFEYFQAGFGAPAPLIDGKLVWADPPDGCAIDPSAYGDLSDTFLVVDRGNCTFAEKAHNVSATNAAAMILVNNGPEGEDLFHVAAGYGGKGVEEVVAPNNTNVVLVRGSTRLALEAAVRWGPATARLVPLKCEAGQAACLPVLPEEREMPLQVESGFIFLASPDNSAGVVLADLVEFVSATFGSTLPQGPVAMASALPPDACTPLLNVEDLVGCMILTRRGGCSFAEKAKHVQNAGGRVIVIADNHDAPLQNIGATEEQAKKLFIPGLFVTAQAGHRLQSWAALPDGGDLVKIHHDDGVAAEWADLAAVVWPEDLLDVRVLKRQLLEAHAISTDRRSWVEHKATALQEKLLAELQAQQAVEGTTDGLKADRQQWRHIEF